MKYHSRACVMLAAALAVLAIAPAISHAQFGTFSKEDLIRFSPDWTGERFPDGRPKVSDDLLERMKRVEIEEAWGVIQGAGYRNQFVGGLLNLHPERVLVGRAVTATFIPLRSDVNKATQAIGKEQGRSQSGQQNSWVIDVLEKGDVLVVDLFGKIVEGTIVGGNLATSIWSKTGGTGLIVDGAVRDLGQISRMPDFSLYYRGADPTAIGGVTLGGLNVPCQIGNALCMPGDVVLGTIEGVLFVPAHMVERVVKEAERVNLRDAFGFQRLKEGKYTPGAIDSRWTPEMEADFTQWLKANIDKLPVAKAQVQEILKEREAQAQPAQPGARPGQ